MALCVRCKQRESTGIMFILCDECFDQFEKECLAKKESDLPLDYLEVIDPKLRSKRTNLDTENS